MPPDALYRSEAFAEDLPCYGADPVPIPRPAARPAPTLAAGPVLWPLAVALTAATVLTLVAPLA